MSERIEDKYTLEEVIQCLWSMHYGKLDWLAKNSNGRLKFPQSEIDRVRKESDILNYLHAGFVKKLEARNAA